jgi:STE24 endopeptidase
VAHELGHHVRRDVPRLLLVQAALIWSGSAASGLFGEWALAAVGAHGGLAEPANLPLLLFGAELFGLLSMPMVNAYSRRREAAADAFALKLTDDPAAFASAMRRLADQNLVERRPPRWAELLLHSHPSIDRRIRRAAGRRQRAVGTGKL